MAEQVRVVAMHLDEAYAVLECSLCGPLGLSLIPDAQARLLAHLASHPPPRVLPSPG